MKRKHAKKSGEKMLRLTGLCDGRGVSFDLKPGCYSIGSLPNNDICLPGKGVSRSHARIHVRQDALEVEDLNSKNGIFINGRKTSSGMLKAGDLLGLGPVNLHVVEIEPEEAQLAIKLERRTQEHKSPVDEDTETRTKSRRSSDKPQLWLELVNDIAGLLLGEEKPDFGRVLARFNEVLGTHGVALLSVDERGEPVVVSSSGVLPEQRSEMLSKLRACCATGERSKKCLSSGFDHGQPPQSWATAKLEEGAVSALVVRGEFPHRQAAGTLLEILLKMLLNCDTFSFHLANDMEACESRHLVFPREFVVGVSEAILSVYEQMKNLLQGDIPVLITGETGVGKDVFAKILHLSSERRGGPFIAINCAAIPSELLEAELFGIEHGVATGVSARPGKFCQAEGGILFLDEVGEMSPSLQAKLLRALQEKEITSVGAKMPRKTDVRVISATNARIEELMEKQSFRRDLYYRIAGYTLKVPPLRERRDDIPLFVEYFLRRDAGEISKKIRGITVGALKKLQQAPWPGNIRELEHELRRLVYMCPEDQAIESYLLSDKVLEPTGRIDLDALTSDLNMDSKVAELEKKLITIALARSKNNRSKAAKLLGISRNGLALKMERLGIDV